MYTQMPCPTCSIRLKKIFFFKSSLVSRHRSAGDGFFSFPISYSISPCETLSVHAHRPSARGYRAETTHLHGGGTSFDCTVSLVVVGWRWGTLLIFSGKFSTHVCTSWTTGYVPNERNRHRTRTGCRVCFRIASKCQQKPAANTRRLKIETNTYYSLYRFGFEKTARKSIP